MAGGGLVVPGQLLHNAELSAGDGLAEPVAEVAEQLKGLLLAGGGSQVVKSSL